MKTIINEDSFIHLKTLDENTFDSCVTDPPYELGFMGKSWDGTGIAFNVDFWKEVLRTLKPGSHLIAFSASRNYHRMAVAIEDAGFEIRDQIMWIYGSGFPKSLNLGKAIDKKPNADLNAFSKALKERRIELGYSLTEADKLITGGTTMYSFLEGRKNDDVYPPNKEYWEKIKEHFGMDSWEKIIENNLKVIGEKDGNFGYQKDGKRWKNTTNETELTSETAKQYEGWGTALKPAHEPIVLARKPLSEKSIVENVLKHGTGGINIDECRIEGEAKHPDTMPDFRDQGKKSKETIGVDKLSFGQVQNAKRKKTQRQPRNKDGVWTEENSGMKAEGAEFADADPRGRFPANVIHDGSEVVQDIFPKTTSTKVSRERKAGSEFGQNSGWNKHNNRDSGLMPAYGDEGSASRFFYVPKAHKKERDGSIHPTIKPVELIKYLVRLITPKDGIVLDPFAGTGTTGEAAIQESVSCYLIEKEKEYIKDIEKRLSKYNEFFMDL